MDLNKLFEDNGDKSRWKEYNKPEPKLTAILGPLIKEYNDERKQDSRTLFRASSIGGCDRRAVYKLNGLKEPIESNSLMIMNIGSSFHSLIQEYLKNCLTSLEEYVSYNEFLGGHYDGLLKKEIIGEECLLEIKTMNVNSYQRMLKFPIIYNKYKIQANVYMKAMNIEKTLFLFVNRNLDYTDEFKKENKDDLDKYHPAFLEVMYHRDDNLIKEIDEKIEIRKTNFENGTLPAYKKTSECSYCALSEICKADRKKEKSEAKKMLQLPGDKKRGRVSKNNKE